MDGGLKVRLDEHLSPRLATAVSEFALSPGWELSSVLGADQAGSSDVMWLRQFADQGGDAIITADKDFKDTPPQVAAVFSTGVKVIYLPPAFGRAKHSIQAAFMLLWWSRIEDTLLSMNARECFGPPWTIRADGELRKIPLDFQKADKRLKRAAKRARRS